MRNTCQNYTELVKRGKGHPGRAEGIARSQFKELVRFWNNKTTERIKTEDEWDEDTIKEVNGVLELANQYPVNAVDIYEDYLESITKSGSTTTSRKPSRTPSRTSQKQAPFDQPKQLRTPSPTPARTIESPTPIRKTPSNLIENPVAPPPSRADPVFLPYAPSTRGDAIRLAKERDAALKENHPEWDLLSKEERDRLREEAADSPPDQETPIKKQSSTPISQFTLSPPTRPNLPRSPSPGITLSKPTTSAKETLIKSFARDISPKPKK